MTEKTRCVLDNYLLCHFHNPDFIANGLTNKAATNKQCSVDSLNGDIVDVQDLISASLTDKYSSCVRQLLNEGKKRNS